MTNRDSGNNGVAVQEEDAIIVASDEKTGIEGVEKTENEASVVASSVGEQESDEKLLEKKVEELKETAKKRAEEVENIRRKIVECRGKLLVSDMRMPKEFLDDLCLQLEVMSSRNGLFLVRNDGFYFNETVRVATKWLERVKKAVVFFESKDGEGWSKLMAGVANAIRGSFMNDQQFWGFPSNGVIDTNGVPTFEKIAKQELGKNK